MIKREIPCATAEVTLEVHKILHYFRYCSVLFYIDLNFNLILELQTNCSRFCKQILLEQTLMLKWSCRLQLLYLSAVVREIFSTLGISHRVFNYLLGSLFAMVYSSIPTEVTLCSPRNSPRQSAIAEGFAEANSVFIVITLAKILPRWLFPSKIYNSLQLLILISWPNYRLQTIDITCTC